MLTYLLVAAAVGILAWYLFLRSDAHEKAPEPMPEPTSKEERVARRWFREHSASIGPSSLSCSPPSSVAKTPEVGVQCVVVPYANRAPIVLRCHASRDFCEVAP